MVVTDHNNITVTLLIVHAADAGLNSPAILIEATD